jgi:hypothetical protein
MNCEKHYPGFEERELFNRLQHSIPDKKKKTSKNLDENCQAFLSNDSKSNG